MEKHIEIFDTATISRSILAIGLLMEEIRIFSIVFAHSNP
jgi:hypothetical protein